MPEIRRTFTAGKMNKDLDERLVRNGEYRDARNIQVRTSDGDDAGTAQNIKGTDPVEGGTQGQAFNTIDYASQRRTRMVGSVADDKNNKAYFLAAAPLPEDGFDSISYSTIMGSESSIPPQPGSVGNQLKHWVDSIIEVDVEEERSSPIFVDKYGVTGRWYDVIGLNVIISGASSFYELGVIDGSIYRVGMIVYFYNLSLIHI